MLKVNPVMEVIDEDSITSENDYDLIQIRPVQYMRYRIVNVINYDDANRNTGSFINNVKVKSDAHDKCFNGYFLKDGVLWFPPLNEHNRVEIYILILQLMRNTVLLMCPVAVIPVVSLINLFMAT